jgi:hypothetical protein
VHTWEAEICATLCSMEDYHLRNIVLHGRLLSVQCWAACNFEGVHDNAICKVALTVHGTNAGIRCLIGGPVTREM